MAQYDGFIRGYIAERISNGMADTTYCEYENMWSKVKAQLRQVKKDAKKL